MNQAHRLLETSVDRARRIRWDRIDALPYNEEVYRRFKTNFPLHNTKFSETVLKRFVRKIKIMDSGCWEWKNSKSFYGYGDFRLNKKSHMAHRLSFRLSVGEIPDGMNILHQCDNPPCVNPDHLHIGTQQQNMRECFDRGRGKLPPKRDCKGEKAPASKLKEHEVMEVFELYKRGLSQEDIGKRFGVKKMAISFILNGRNWGHLGLHSDYKKRRNLSK